MKNSPELIGVLNKDITDYFNLKENYVYIGEQNKEHMKSKHWDEYEAYFQYISEIISSPDYYGKNLKDDSIELIKEFEVAEKVYIKVAVRISNKGKLFARTLYQLSNKDRFEYQLKQGFYKKVKSS